MEQQLWYFPEAMADERKSSRTRMSIELSPAEDTFLFELRFALARNGRTLRDFVMEAVRKQEAKEQIVPSAIRDALREKLTREKK